MVQQTRHLLQTKSLRFTQPRSVILAVFLQKETALSERDLEDQLLGKCDRTTIYRTLATFMDRGILHKVLDDQGAIKYALCAQDCKADTTHQHDHVHFKCHVCGETRCINQVVMPPVELPAGFVLKEVNTLFQGICPDCTP